MEKSKVKLVKENESPCSYADRIGLQYSETVSQESKKGKGQFFTPIKIATLMASLVDSSNKNSIKILDPGCGTGILSCALIERLIEKNKVKQIELTAYETDLNLISYSKKVFDYLKEWLAQKKIVLNYKIHSLDFILSNSNWQKNEKHSFDYVISNPPYFKLSKDDPRTLAAKAVVSGHTNIYSVFMAFSAKMLNDTGQLIFITPRSFASGSYFKVFRDFFFNIVQLDKIHLFVSRRDTFNRDSVLQETVILKASKQESINSQKEVTIFSSVGIKDIDQSVKKTFLLQSLIDLSSEEKILHLPTNDNEESILNIVKGWRGSLHKYNIQISTGPVVSFRALEYIQDHYQNGTEFLAPLFWLHNVNKMSLNWPLQRIGKG